jgi:predicted O-methyltransferase YrrM
MYAVAPETATAVMSARAREHSHRLVREWGLIDLNRKLIDRFGSVVQRSPFTGMTLSPMTHLEHLGPFLLGTYEEELHPWFESAMSGRFEQILDIGSKFGYYAVGLARRMPDTPVIAFDTDRWARRATKEMAEANRTPRVAVEGFCSARWLSRHIRPHSFILSDCEGYEGELFANASTPALDSATLIVEIHDGLVPGVGSRIRERFRRTHAISSVRSQERERAGIDLGFLSSEEARTAIREIRGPQEWLLMSPVIEKSRCA